jgi:hypothetical protein
MLSATVPVLLNVTVCGVLVVLRICVLNVRLEGAKAGVGPVPLPLRVIIWGLTGTLSATLSVPMRKPVALGVNVTLRLQFAPGLRGPLQLFVALKSPAVVVLVTVSGALPTLVRVMD